MHIPKVAASGTLASERGRRGPCPPGYIIVAADWRGFETRLHASDTGDPNLLAAANQVDVHAAIAAQLRTPTSAVHVKHCIHPMTYGQGRAGFWMACPELPRKHAERLFDDVAAFAFVAQRVQEDCFANHRWRSPVRTPSGWCRRPAKKREAFNVRIQGLGADILRWVLRELDARVASIGGFLLHQAHDEVFLAVPPENAAGAERLLMTVMNEAVCERSGLLPRDVPLFVKIRRGRTWADLI